MLPESITIMGDPHLGRKFKTGVPLHRIGEREEMVWKQFERELHNHDGSIHVNMGDLFDKRVVSPEVLLRAAANYRAAAKRLTGCTFVVIMGNHDMSRDTSMGSSFDIFTELMAGVKNVVIIRDEPQVIDGYGFVPYHPFRPTSELVAELPDKLKAVFGHWDIQDWGGDNVIPTELLAKKRIKLAFSGHDHLKREETRHGVKIIVTGSMQPYTHAEDDTGDWYVTVTLDQLAEMDVRNKNVRVLLRDGETLPSDLDCLSLTAKRLVSEEDAIEVDTSEFESLDISQLLANALEGLSVKDDIMEVFHNAA